MTGILHGVRDLLCQLEVVSLLCAIRIHAGQQNFARTERGNFPGPFDDVKLSPGPAAMRENFRAAILAPRIDGNDNALASKPFGSFLH